MIASLVASLVIFLVFKEAPGWKLFWIWQLLCFVMSMVWIFAIADILVDIVNLLGIITPIDTQVLALSVISWGNCSGDAVTAYSVSKNGHGEMALTGGIASALTNLILGQGLTSLRSNL